MIEVHLYGILRMIVPGSTPNENTVLYVESRKDEEFQHFIRRIGLDFTKLGDCFINGVLAISTDIVQSGDRVGLFPFNMRLIDGGMELKYSPHKR